MRRPTTPWVMALLLAGCSGEQTAPPLDLGAGQDRGARDLSGEQPVPDLTAPGDAALPAPDSGAPCVAPGLPSGSHTLTLQHGGVERSYLLYVPSAYTNTSRCPLVLNFHGASSNPTQQVFFSGMNASADKAGFILAYPAGIQNTWNAGLCCGDAARQQVDDVGFVRAVVADVQKRVCVDGKRIYASGMSNGAMLSYRLACEASDLFAAIGPVAGALVLGKPCSPQRPVPVVHLHGTLDTLVEYSSATSTIAGWVSRNGCTDASPVQVYSKGIATCEAYTQCKAGAEVVFCTITGGGHCWPGQPFCPFGLSSMDISANEMIWGLFKKHALP